jgi:hypothetical protein
MTMTMTIGIIIDGMFFTLSFHCTKIYLDNTTTMPSTTTTTTTELLPNCHNDEGWGSRHVRYFFCSFSFYLTGNHYLQVDYERRNKPPTP